MPEEPYDAGLAEQMPTGIKVLPAAFPRGRIIRAMRRLIPYGVWLPRAWVACCHAIRRYRPDALLTSSPPHCVQLLGYYLQRRFKLPWVADFRDPWITGRTPKENHRFRLSWESRWERKVIARADIVVANAPLAAQWLQEAFPSYPGKVRTILNGFDAENVTSVPAPHSSNGTLRILHTGELYAGRDPRPFLDAVQELQRNGAESLPPICVSFLGRNDMGSRRFRAEILRRSLDTLVEVGGQVAYDEAIQAMKNSDILLLLDTPGRRIGVPAKLYEYIGVGRPILALAERDGDVAWALRQSGIRHRIASSSDPTQIKQALAELIGEIRENRLDTPTKQQRFLFTREGMASQLAEVLNNSLPNNPEPHLEKLQANSQPLSNS
jgi:glycosyltransferase involved in cell wall biosynthesis